MKKLSKSTRSCFINYGIVILAYAIIQTLLSQGALSNSLKSLLVPV